MFPFSVTILATVPQRLEIPGLINYPVFIMIKKPRALKITFTHG
jgi:hypothetical protein